MVAKLELVKIEPGTYLGISTVGLLDYTNGFGLVYGGWIRNAETTANDNDVGIPESLTLNIRSTSDDNLAAVLQLLETKKREVDNSRQMSNQTVVVLRVKLTDESNELQAIVKTMEYQTPSFYGAQNDNLVSMRLGIGRGNWESPTVSTKSPVSSLTIAGGNHEAYSGVTGDISARLDQVRFLYVSGGELLEFWAGFRGTRYGDPDYFSYAWSIHSTSDFGADTAAIGTPDVTATSGYVTECTFLTVQTAAERFFMLVEDATAYPDEQKGTFLVLLRARMTSGASSAYCRLLSGWLKDTKRKNGRVLVDKTDWFLYNLGTVEIPGGAGYASNMIVDKFGMGVEAERVTGTSESLYMDSIILIPTDEGYVYGTGASIHAADERFIIGHDIKLQTVGLSVSGSPDFTVEKTGTAQSVGGLPTESGRTIIAGQSSVSNYNHPVLGSDTVTVEMKYYRRWATLRGAEA